MAAKQTSSERKGLYYLGMLVSLIGVLLFASVFLAGILHTGDSPDLKPHGRSEGLRAFFGIALAVAGGVLARVGTRGFAGSGIIIDPEKAREDIQPRPGAAGGAPKRGLDETSIDPDRLTLDAEMPLDEKLRRLDQMRENGFLTEEDYSRKKAGLPDKS